MPDFFRGPRSLTYPGERLAFYLTLLFAFPAAAAIGFVIHEQVGVSQVALFLVIAMVYVTLARGRLVGSSVRITQTQYPHVFAIVQRCAAALALPMPLVFVREDTVTPVLAVGFGEPYSLILSSHWVEHFADDELTFMIGRELGHIAAGHTRYTSLLSVNGNENAIVSIVFGAWLRKMELTCDRIGLLCCGSLDSAIRAIAIASFHHFGRKIDHRLFAEQAREVGADPIFRLGEWLGSKPYATTRVDAMSSFIGSNLYRLHEETLVHESAAMPLQLADAAGALVAKKDCAGWWRRMGALLLDMIIVSAILQTIFLGNTGHAATLVQPAHISDLRRTILKTPEEFSVGSISFHDGGIVIGKHTVVGFDSLGGLATSWWALPGWFAIYSVLLVGLVGQTLGMLVAGLRVVRTNFSRPGIAQSVWRYIVLTTIWPVIWALSPFSRIFLHDRASGTRVIKTERLLSRVG